MSMEPDVITSGAQGKLSGLQLEIELTNKVLDVQDESGYRQRFQIREQGGEGGLGVVVGGGGGWVDVYKLFTRAEGKKKSNTMSKKWSHLFSTHKETSRPLW